MSSQLRRDPVRDSLLTPENCALLVIDYQPPQMNTIRSMDSAKLLSNVLAVIETAKLFHLPMILTSVGVASGVNPDTVPAVKSAMEGAPSMDRTSINAWEDVEFLAAVKATGRKKLIMCALWTEVCLAFPALDALREGYEVFPVVDAVAGTSTEAHDAALRRIEQSGAQPISWISLLCELQRDWARTATAGGMIQVGLNQGGPWATEIAIKQFAKVGSA